MFKSLSVEEISNYLKLSFIGKNKIIKGVSTLKNATEDQITFFSNSKYANELSITKAGACLIKAEDVKFAGEDITKIICKDPYLNYAYLLDLLVDEEINSNVSLTAHISETANIGEGCSIGANVFIGGGVKIGSNVRIGHAVTLENCEIGDNCIIHPGVRIGQDGFGFTLGIDGNMKKIRQLGKVVIGSNVEIGANTSIDRGAIENTIIGDYTKIDNLVQIGHNVIIGRNCIICAQVGIAGSAKIGNYVIIGGQVGINGHISIGDRVQIAAKSGVSNNLSDDERVGGCPAVNIIDWHKQTIFLKRATKK